MKMRVLGGVLEVSAQGLGCMGMNGDSRDFWIVGLHKESFE